jgi:CDP-diacylglycerol--glycerol-3-phosphate 3-phosphatidyltransferase
MLTILRLFFIPVVIVLYKLGLHYWAAGLFVLAAVTDFFDGYLARKTNTVSAFGKFFDPIADKVLMLAALAVLGEAGKLDSIWIVVILTRDFLISGLRMFAVSEGVVIAASWLGKVKTVVQDVALVLLMIENFPFCYIGIPMDRIALYLAVALTVWSGIDYLVKNKEILKRLNQKS